MQLVKEYREVEVKVWLSDCNAGVRAMLKRGDFAARIKENGSNSGFTGLVFPELKDALATIVHNKAYTKY